MKTKQGLFTDGALTAGCVDRRATDRQTYALSKLGTLYVVESYDKQTGRESSSLFTKLADARKAFLAGY